MISWEISRPAEIRRKIKNESKKDPHAHVRRMQGTEAEKELLRIVALPTGIIEVDRTGKKSGRGVYVCDNMDCFTKAYESHGLEKSLKRPVSKEVYEALKSQIENG